VVSSVARVIRLCSFVGCIAVLASFALFAVDQTRSASIEQSRKVEPALSTATAASGSAGPASAAAASHRHGSLRRTVESASNTLTSPFSGVVSSSSEWLDRAVKLALALAVYGFGLGYLARVLRVRA
jgi:uncharacterized membrane protein YsdA (DUF1294 family)